jgi:hypothetical protein
MSLVKVTSLAVVLDWPALASMDSSNTMAAARLHRMQVFGSVMTAILSETWAHVHQKIMRALNVNIRFPVAFWILPNTLLLMPRTGLPN